MSSSCLQPVPTDLGFGCWSAMLESRVDARVAGAGSEGKEEGGSDMLVMVVNLEPWRVRFFGREAEQRFGDGGVPCSAIRCISQVVRLIEGLVYHTYRRSVRSSHNQHGRDHSHVSTTLSSQQTFR